MGHSSWGWEQRNAAGWIYILRFSNGLFKIGRTIHLETRLKVHKREYRDPDAKLVAVKHVANCLMAEKKWHRAFSDKRVRSQWNGLPEHFQLTDSDIEKFIEGD